MLHRLLYVQVNMIGLFIIGLIYFSQGKRAAHDLDQRYFTRLLLANALILVFDAVTWLVDGQTAHVTDHINQVSNFLYYFTMPWIPYYWLCYCDCRIYGDEAALKKRLRYYKIPLFVNTVLVILTLFTGWAYYIDAARVYHRGSGFVLYSALVFPDMFVAFFLPFLKSFRVKGSRRKEYRLLSMFIMFPLVCGIIQFFFYGVGFTWTSIALAELMIYVNVQNRQISTDELTGVNNRRRFNRYMENLFDGKGPENPMAMILMDIDDFKQINDSFGHQTGDDALMRTANVLKRCCSDNRYFLARTGGDEFVMTIRDCDAATAQYVVARINSAIQEESGRPGVPYRLSISIGCAMLGEDGVFDPDELFSLADSRMYLAKTAKKAARASLACE